MPQVHELYELWAGDSELRDELGHSLSPRGTDWLFELFAALGPQVARELGELLAYPEDSAGRLMDPRVSPLRAGAGVAEGLARLRALKRRGLREIFVVDDEGRLAGRVEIQDLATAEESEPLRAITRSIVVAVRDLDRREDVVAASITILSSPGLHGDPADPRFAAHRLSVLIILRFCARHVVQESRRLPARRRLVP